jgi:hypothetical protein
VIPLRDCFERGVVDVAVLDVLGCGRIEIAVDSQLNLRDPAPIQVSPASVGVAQIGRTRLVEVATVLDPWEKSVFDSMVTQLRGDQRFVQRIDMLGQRRKRQRTAVAILLWTFAPIAMIVGGWTGFFMAIVAVGYAIRLVTRKPGFAEGDGFSWWSSPGRRPGASL